MKEPMVYMITDSTNDKLYIGVTSDIRKRIYQHRNKFYKGFSSKHNLWKLVYVEEFSRMDEAILREKRLKQWKRAWKNRLINEFNPQWNDLYAE